MNVDEIITKYKLLEEELQKTKDELIQTKEHLKKYTAPSYKKEYYEKNKEVINERNKNYKPTPEQKKEYNRREYLKRKEKIKKETSENI